MREERTKRGVCARVVSTPAIRKAKAVVGEHGLRLGRPGVAKLGAQKSGLDGFFVATQQHRDVRKRRQSVRLSLRVTGLLEELRGTPRRLAGAPEFRADAIAVRQARHGARLCVQVDSARAVQDGLGQFAGIVQTSVGQGRVCFSQQAVELSRIHCQFVSLEGGPMEGPRVDDRIGIGCFSA